MEAWAWCGSLGTYESPYRLELHGEEGMSTYQGIGLVHGQLMDLGTKISVSGIQLADFACASP